MVQSLGCITLWKNIKSFIQILKWKCGKCILAKKLVSRSSWFLLVCLLCSYLVTDIAMSGIFNTTKIQLDHLIFHKISIFSWRSKFKYLKAIFHFINIADLFSKSFQLIPRIMIKISILVCFKIWKVNWIEGSWSISPTFWTKLLLR